jgi:type IX secretion system PorP/SprF family membrane protein
MRKFLFCAVVLVCGFDLALNAQDIHFTQYTSAPMLLNPALTASWKEFELTLQQRQQWQSVKAFSTSGLSFEIKAGRFNWLKLDRMTALYKKKLLKGLAFGVYAYSDRAGDGALRTNNIDLGAAYHARLDDLNAISGGIIGGVIQQSIDPDKLRWNTQYGSNGYYDPNLASGEVIDASHLRADFGAGVLWTYGKTNRTITSNDETNFHVGISMMHINQPDISFTSYGDPLARRVTFHGAGMIHIENTNMAVCPSFAMMRQGKQSELSLGMLAKFELKESAKVTGFIKGASVLMGAYYRHKDAIAPYFGLEFASYALGVSYDANISSLKAVTKGNGGIEVMLRWQNPTAFLWQNKASF